MADSATLNPSRLSLTDKLSLERTRIAYERTMMAWVRTATSLITFGFAVYKFFQLDMSQRDVGKLIIGSREFALMLIGIGLLSLITGTIEHRRDMMVLGKQYPGMPWSATRLIAFLSGTLGLLAFLAVIFRS
jgi:putative membrane protein